MKFIHLSDLHLGKRYNEVSLIDDQSYILKVILQAIDEEKPNAVLICGDVYDKSVPSAEAVELFDKFLSSLVQKGVEVFIVSGNHDSPERIAFGGKIMEKAGVHLSPVYNGEVMPTLLFDELGEVAIYMLPFVKPAHVRRYFQEEEIENYTDALSVAISHMHIDEGKRNVLLAHQFVTGSTQAGSEEFLVGDAGNVDERVFSPFDYVALGHIHGEQTLNGKIRYCGSPLKYSLNEAKKGKSITVVEVAKKGELSVRTIPIVPKREVVELRGSYDELCRRDFYKDTTLQEDYVHIVLTDEEEIPDVVGKLRIIYHNLMNVRYDNTRTRFVNADLEVEKVEEKSPAELFKELYEKQNNQPMSKEQEALIKELIEECWRDDE